ncbi:GNAT family N-acetyltransferase [Desulfopila sp. IMCC35008]|uniref:GNAT family N-acetyltransferase n=1 Tax=Desulfopila sp. IMCC35008 TaxID=2653858 RepID=UPI0013D8BA1F|nr:GNAT family N-acetyltransferase [Desulfopila sp. IMCC35008]
MIEIHSERLLIRDHLQSDLESMHAWVSDPELMKFLAWKTSTLSETQKLLDDAISEINLQRRKKYFFAVVHNESHKIIGDVGFTILSGNKFGGLADSGFFFLKEFWGSGYATEELIDPHQLLKCQN